jgi:hypothetical protein
VHLLASARNESWSALATQARTHVYAVITYAVITGVMGVPSGSTLFLEQERCR